MPLPQQPDAVAGGARPPHNLRAEATELLVRLTGDPVATFHPGQFEAIEALVENRRRALVIQRTGWGKSAVYFLSALLLRRRGSGPALAVVAIIFSWMATSNHYIRQSTIYRAWENSRLPENKGFKRKKKEVL